MANSKMNIFFEFSNITRPEKNEKLRIFAQIRAILNKFLRKLRIPLKILRIFLQLLYKIQMFFKMPTKHSTHRSLILNDNGSSRALYTTGRFIEADHRFQGVAHQGLAPRLGPRPIPRRLGVSILGSRDTPRSRDVSGAVLILLATVESIFLMVFKGILNFLKKFSGIAQHF